MYCNVTRQDIISRRNGTLRLMKEQSKVRAPATIADAAAHCRKCTFSRPPPFGEVSTLISDFFADARHLPKSVRRISLLSKKKKKEKKCHALIEAYTRVFPSNLYFLQGTNKTRWNFISIVSMALMILAFSLTWPYCSVDSKRYHGDRYIFQPSNRKFYRPPSAI